MTVNTNVCIDYMYSLRARGVTYSMTGSRTGRDGTGDCSGTIYQGLRDGGASNAGWILNTDSMHSWLVKNGFKLIAYNKSWNMKRGDIIIFGKKGSSGGSAGHMCIAVNGTDVIDCAWYGSSTAPAVRVNNENTMPYSMGWYVYRIEGGSSNGSSNSSNEGWVKENATFTSTSNSINLRDNPVNGKVIAVIKRGQSVKYDAYKTIGNQVWVRQPRSNGKYGYICVRENGKAWGTFK